MSKSEPPLNPLEEEEEEDEDYEPSEGGDVSEEYDSGANSEGEESGKKGNDEDEKKKRIDDLWASMNAELDLPKKNSPKPPKVEEPEEEPEKPKEKNIKITEIFDFAGEDVKIVRTVEAGSKEAEKALKRTQAVLDEPESTSKKSGLDAIVGKINKKKKLSTMQKSHIDWQVYKTNSGVAEQLEEYSKDGYLEKQDFLDRTEWKKFEMSRDAREVLRRMERRK